MLLFCRNLSSSITSSKPIAENSASGMPCQMPDKKEGKYANEWLFQSNQIIRAASNIAILSQTEWHIISH